MPQPLNPAEQKVLDDVEQYGLHVVNVLAEGDLPEFSYTIGLYKNFNHPEVLVYGLPRNRAHPLLNDVGDEVRAGKKYLAGQTYDDFLEGYRCTFRTIPVTQYPEYLGWASWFYDHGPFPSLQLVYPDREGRWPWQEGVSEGFRSCQLILADVPASDSDGAA